jgi:peptidoglycan-associated lipoprotein
MFARYKSSGQILNTMFKSLRIAVPFILAAFMLTACTRKQGPTPVGTQTGGSGSGEYGDIIPSLDGSYGPDADDLELRGDGMGDGMYNGREMLGGVLPSVYFDFDSFSVAASERGKVQQAADYLMENPTSGLLLEGHCDWSGTADYNLALGERRSNSVRDYLSTLGVTTGRIEILSKGSLKATPGLPKAESGQDRRSDLIILK